MSKPVIVNGYEVRFERRNYPLSTGGRKTFTWCEAFINGEWTSLGDPFEKLRPSNREIMEEIDKRK